jgi:acetyl esterase/lipase
MKTLTLLAALLVGFQDAAPKKRGFLGAQVEQDGAVLKVVRVIPNGPAEKAGLVVGDQILKLDGAAVTTVQAFVKSMQERGAGGEFKFQVSRGTREYEVKIVLALHPEEADPSPGMHKVKKTLDIAYGDHERHKLNLFLPETDKPFPTVMWIHAGAWSFGGREGETALAMRFAERGIGFATISHRLTGGAWWDAKLPKEGVRHPAHVEDAARAFAWLHANLKARGGDPDRIFVSGHSSGAHLVALLAMDPKYLKAHKLPLSAIRGSIPIGGAYDMTKYHERLIEGIGQEKADAHLEAILGPRSTWEAASPSAYVNDATVPMLVITEEEPGFQMYKADFEAVVPKGSPISFWTAAGREHQNITSMMARMEPDAPRDRMIEFIRSQAKN